MRYSLLNKEVKIEHLTDQALPPVLERFRSTKETEESAVTIHLSSVENTGYGIETIPGIGSSVCNVFFSQKDPGQVLCALKKDYTEFVLAMRGTCSEEVLLELLMTAFYSYISLEPALLIHASAVEYQGQGIVFTAPSGTGKSTQAELWAGHRDAVILNGDKVFLKREERNIHAWGSPWKGSSAYAENRSIPLKTIVVLEQAEENKIQKLEGLNVLQYVVPHVFFPSWEERCEQKVLTFLDEVLQETDVYLLQCRPDEDAVALVEEAIMK